MFIIGSSRSGTTWLQSMLAEHPRVASSTEMSTYHGYIGPLVRTWDKEKKKYDEHITKQANIEIDEGMIGGLAVLWTENEFVDYLNTFLAITHEKYLRKNPNASHILEKDQRISLFTDEINRFHRDAKFVHLLRDGRDVICSKVAARERIGFGPFSVKEGIEDWRRYLFAARQASSFGVNRYLEVRYEDLLESTHKELEMIFSFCELETNSALIDTIVSNNTFEVMKKLRKTPDKDFVVNPKFFYKGKSGNWRVDLSPEDQYMFSRIAGELLIDLGYVNNNEWWYSSIGQKYKLILFSIFKEKLDEFKSLIKSIYLFLTRRS